MGLLTILEYVEKLAYRLEILPIWKIHPVILIAHLEPAMNPADDPYQRPRLDHPGPVEPEEEMKFTGDHYIIKKLLGKQVTQGQIQYLI